MAQSNNNLLQLNKKVRALEMENESIQTSHSKKLKKQSEVEKERMKEMMDDLEKEKRKSKKLKEQLESK